MEYFMPKKPTATNATRTRATKDDVPGRGYDLIQHTERNQKAIVDLNFKVSREFRRGLSAWRSIPTSRTWNCSS